MRRALLALVFLHGCGEPQTPPSLADARDDLFSVAIADGRVVAVGDRGAVWRSDDAGDTWSHARAPTERALTSVSLAGAGQGFAVGRDGVILATRDAGQSWELRAHPRSGDGAHLLAVHALDARRALAVGSRGLRLRTDDGGLSWRDESLRAGRTAADVLLQDVACAPGGGACWLVGEFGTLLRSDDAGASWERGAIGSPVAAQAIDFAPGGAEPGADAERAIAAFAASLDAPGGGVGQAPESWAGVAIAARVGADEIAALRGDPDALFERTAERVDAARRALVAAGVARERVREPDPPPWEHAERGADGPALVARWIERHRATRGGVALSALHEPVLFGVRPDGPAGAWACGLGGLVLRSGDGGRTWARLATPPGRPLFAIAPAPDGGAIAAGEAGLVRIPPDGGEPAPLAAGGGFVRDVRFSAERPELGFAVGARGRILRTRDGGATWEALDDR